MKSGSRQTALTSDDLIVLIQPGIRLGMLKTTEPSGQARQGRRATDVETEKHDRISGMTSRQSVLQCGPVHFAPNGSYAVATIDLPVRTVRVQKTGKNI